MLTRRIALSVLALACAVPVAAHADTTYLVNGTFAGNIAVTGQYTISSAGYITSADLMSDGLTFTADNSPQVASPPFGNFSYAIIYEAGATSGPDIQLDIYASSTLCSTAVSDPCSLFGSPQTSYLTDGSGTHDLASGTAVAATPEPSSVVLLGTGIVGLAGAARRRLAKV